MYPNARVDQLTKIVLITRDLFAYNKDVKNLHKNGVNNFATSSVTISLIRDIRIRIDMRIDSCTFKRSTTTR